jgi:hypothetical protein
MGVIKGKNGGARAGAGRKRKEEEKSLIEKLKPYENAALFALANAIEDGKDWAVKLFFQYRYGIPKQIVDQNPNSDNEIHIKII